MTVSRRSFSCWAAGALRPTSLRSLVASATARAAVRTRSPSAVVRMGVRRPFPRTPTRSISPRRSMPSRTSDIDLDAAERRGGVPLQSGDALVVRSGWGFSWDSEEQAPGMTVDAVTWMHERGVALYAGDVGDSFPPHDPEMPMPMHMVALARLGMPLIDSADVEQLAVVCAELSRWSFLLSVAPPRLLGLTGVPVNPIAVF
ncbi:hypothetical protein C5C37_13750 [Rathayibacter sp. AY1F9]|nr:hypothetical protein C5C37_13750 [Rathayibacter sp. AY1F9]